jgi:c-di-AMP phosphodiesterase-like protein
MVSELLQYINNGVKYSGAVADCLYAGMVLDKQGFTAKTGVRTFEAAAYLRRSGADVTRVRKMFREDASDYKAKAETVHNMELYRKYYAISVCDAEGLKEPTVVAAQAANDLLNINAVKASFVMVEHQNKIFISGRSIDEVNVQVILEKLGGGGHLNMAGAQLENTNIDAAIIVLKSTLDTMIQEGEL